MKKNSTHHIALIALACATVFGSVTAHSEEVIRVWTRSSSDGRLTYDEIAAAFTKKTGIKVEYFNAMSDYEQRLARAAAGGDLPDVVINSSDSLGQFVSMGIANEINRGTLKGGEHLWDRAWASARSFNGKYYAVPTSAHSFVLIIRKDWRTKLGLPVPKTWADVENLAKAFVENDPDGNGKKDTYGFVFPGSTSRGYTSWFISSFLWQAGGDFIKPMPGNKFQASLDTPEAATTMKFFRGLMCDSKVTQPGAINATTADANPSFRSGAAGMYFTGPYALSLYDKDFGREKIEVVAPPIGPKNGETLAEGELAFIMKSSKKQAAAQSFIEFLVSEEGQLIGMVSKSKFPIVRLSVNKNIKSGAVYQDPRWQLVSDVYEKQGHYVPSIPNWSPVRQVSADGFNKILSRCDSDITAGLKEVNAKVNVELGKQKVLAN